MNGECTQYNTNNTLLDEVGGEEVEFIKRIRKNLLEREGGEDEQQRRWWEERE